MSGPFSRYPFDDLGATEQASLPERPSVQGQQPDIEANDAELLALQPSALFLLDQAGILIRLGGNWQGVTGLRPEQVLGRPLHQFVKLPPSSHPQGLYAQSGVCEEASIGRGGLSKRVRLVWQRGEGGTGGSLELPGPREREIYERSEKLRRAEVALEQTITCLGTTLDTFQSHHVKRMVSYAVRLGQAYGLSEQDLSALRWGATLHDVGKVRVPQHILIKTGPLSAEEFGVVLQHPQWGAEILGQLDFLPDAARDAVLHHHERWDGQGYPAGLREDQIPLLARIVMIADVFDALTSDRSYKTAWTPAAAGEYLIRESGRAFEGDLVRLFLERVMDLGYLYGDQASTL
ncbi:HD-GYP domain-containing protein [Deinococcus psychrotolerans]|uniref:HD-GYP domain-containing protein n=1 Tax=Deinococcus psychrotolerans TaxID=2489213 RepID=A0A3G8YAI4_9DEIO|nr:HD-GYP domain-containing protein [Deinococcus psychrotolerans]AZI41913.1 HD-GYP domain-containing protein [Deinococcus psychrotolerans]